MTFVRSIGRWTMTALVINTIVGSGIFGVPSELTHLVGSASPIAMLIAALLMAVIVGCFVEVGSQFKDPGGAYLYVRTAFGRFWGLQVGWFWLLANIGSAAASADLCLMYLGGIAPRLSHGMGRALVMAAMIAFPALVNYLGVGRGATLSSILTIAKLLPLFLLITLGLLHGHDAEAVHVANAAQFGWKAWLSALLLLMFSYGGYEDALVPMGEVRHPRRTVPFGLITGLLVCGVLYMLLQFVTVATIGTAATDHPLADVASVLMGRGGALFVAFAVILSTYGWIAGAVLNAPRLPFAFAAQGDLPTSFGELHARYSTPAIAIIVYGVLVFILAVTGTFLWVAAVTAGSMMVLYSGTCAALIRLRRLQPGADALRIRGGPALALGGIFLCFLLLTTLELRQALLMGVTAAVAAANWRWAARRDAKPAKQGPIAAGTTS